MVFQAGNNANPGGRPKGTKNDHAARLARVHADAAVEVLAAGLKDESAAIRLASAVHLLDRGFGKPKEFVELKTDDETLAAIRELQSTDSWLRGVLGRTEEASPPQSLPN